MHTQKPYTFNFIFDESGKITTNRRTIPCNKYARKTANNNHNEVGGCSGNYLKMMCIVGSLRASFFAWDWKVIKNTANNRFCSAGSSINRKFQLGS